MSEIENQRKILDSFVVDNDHLEELSARLAKFNVFDVLRVGSAEIRHSNVLAWLLSPSGTHGLGDLFLRKFLSMLLMENEDQGRSIAPAKAQLMPLDDVEVLREWQNIDVLVTSKSECWCLLIENKIKASESKGQLRRYFNLVEKEFPGHSIIPVFLTLAGEDPSEDGRDLGYISLSYETVLPIVEKVARQHASRMPEDAKMFVRHYCETLRRLTMQDEELVDLCKQIYRKHRDAIELIIQVGASSEVLDTAKVSVEGLDDIEFVDGPSASRIWFLTNEMAQSQREIGSGWKFLRKAYPVMIWLWHDKKSDRLQLSIEIGEVDDSDTRYAIVKAFDVNGFNLRKDAFKEGGRFTRVKTFSHNLKRTENDEYESIERAVKELWKKAHGVLPRVVIALQSVSWPAE